MLDKIKMLHVEPTTRCNAWCSGCSRNKGGFGLKDGLILEDLKINRLKEILDGAKQLKWVTFCGTNGDPCASKIIDQQLDLVYDRKIHLRLHTNGSLRNEEWWKKIAMKFKDKIEVWFGLDGLEDTHSYYRQGTNWRKIINNAKSFINSGGNAVWQFIPFAHNEHQIKSCMKLSQQLGFKEFRFVKDARYRKTFHYKTGEELDVKPWSGHHQTWKRRNKGLLNTIQDPNYTKTKIELNDCVHLSFPSLFLNAHGTITPCCMHGAKDIENFDIKKNFIEKKWLATCIRNCGS